MSFEPATPTAAEAVADLIDTFEALPDWQERYGHIIELGQALPPLPPELKTEANKVHGCQSQVWMAIDQQNGKLRIRAISDAIIVSGLIALLLQVYHGRSPQEILATSPEFLKDLGLDRHLSPTRSNGLHAMVKRVLAEAERFASQG